MTKQVVFESCDQPINIMHFVYMMHTNHLGDSGMKYNPGINSAHGKTPAKENRVMR